MFKSLFRYIYKMEFQHCFEEKEGFVQLIFQLSCAQHVYSFMKLRVFIHSCHICSLIVCLSMKFYYVILFKSVT